MLEKIWKPDTFFHNGLDSYLHTITRPNKLFRCHLYFMMFCMSLVATINIDFDDQDLWGGGHNIQHATDHQGQVPYDALQLSHGLAIVSSHIWLMWVFHSHEGPIKELKCWEPQWWWWWQEMDLFPANRRLVIAFWEITSPKRPKSHAQNAICNKLKDSRRWQVMKSIHQ